MLCALPGSALITVRTLIFFKMNLPTTRYVLIGKLESETIRSISELVGQNLDVRFENYFDFLQSKESSKPTVVIQTHKTTDQLEKTLSERIEPFNIEFVDFFPHSSSKDSISSLNEIVVSDSNESLESSISRAEQLLAQRSPTLTHKKYEPLSERFNLFGTSRLFTKALATIEKFSRTESRVLLRGETGTGKELVARAIHYMGPRARGPFVPINCGAFNDELLLSELFGHRKGAFTGADETQVGLLELADGGTIFLDEVDSLSPKAQVSLLRYLQEGEIRPLGSKVVRKVDVRVISATNKKLADLVRREKFRDDLLYRLDVLSVNLPPLRSRDEDALIASMQFLARLSEELDEDPKILGQNVIDTILDYDWPGNFRELESSLTRAFLMTEEHVIRNPSLLFSHTDENDQALASQVGSFSSEKQALISRFEKQYIERVLARTSGNISEAARIAQKERRAFSRLMDKHGIRKEKFVA